MTRTSLLLVSPIMPDDHGNGLAMRVGTALRALSSNFDVHLALVPVAGGPLTPSPLVQERSASLRILPLAEHLDPYYGLIERIIDPAERGRANIAYPKPYLSRFCTSQSASVIEDWRKHTDASILHVVRLYLAPLAYGSAAQRRIIDLDEDDVTTYRRIAILHRQAGRDSLAALDDAEATKFVAIGTQHLNSFERVLVSSRVEAELLQKRVPNSVIRLVANAAPSVRPVPRDAVQPQNRPLRLLFVGNLGYAPNEDAIHYLCREILPRLRATANRPVTATIVGGGARKELAAVASGCEIRLLGPVDDLAPLYANADVAIAPIRAGGGTRIKILEAFAFGTPVVATTAAIEGIDAKNGEHAMIADGADNFASACLTLVNDPEQAHAMAVRGRQLVNDVYEINRIEAALLAAYAELV